MGALTWFYAARNGTGAERAAIAGVITRHFLFWPS
jgi:hypothetical protein